MEGDAQPDPLIGPEEVELITEAGNQRRKEKRKRGRAEVNSDRDKEYDRYVFPDSSPETISLWLAENWWNSRR
jgi:hypothetical protein